MSEITSPNSVEWAAAAGELDTLKLLMKAQKYDPKQIGYNGRNLLHFACIRNLDTVKYLINDHELDPLFRDNDDKTPFHIACENGQLDIVMYLVNDQEVDPCYTSGDNTPLHGACGGGNLELVKFLVEEKKCDPTQIVLTEKVYAVSPLHLACKKGHLDIVRYLVEEQRVNPADTTDDQYEAFVPPLHVACSEGHLEVMKYLIGKGCSLTQMTKGHGGTSLSAFHYACIAGHVNVVRYFIDELKWDPMSETEYRDTPLHLACKQGHLELVKYLVNEKLIDPVDASKNGETPFHVACEAGRLEIVKFLVEKRDCDPMQRNKYTTPYASACATGQLDVIRYLTEKRQCDPECKDDRGLCAIDFAVFAGNMDILKYFVEKRGCDLRSDTHLIRAVQGGNPETISYISSIVSSSSHPLTIQDEEQLESKDLAFLVNHLKPMASRWKAFGLQLELLPGDLDTIEATPLLIPVGPVAFLQEVLSRWLNRALPPPTLTKLCDALRSHAVEENRIAHELEQQHQTWRTAQKWDEDHELKSLVKEAEPTGRQLGAGAYGSVEQVKIEGTTYAAKRFRVEIYKSPNESHEKFFAELRILCSIRHPNIVQYHCVCFLPNSKSPALVMEQLQTNLHDYLSYANLSLNAKVSILHDIAGGLAYLHNHKPAVIHRDLTARNVLLNSDRVAKISDFGNSRIIDVDPACSSEFISTSHVPGTTIYMPPEASSDHAKFNKKLDIFSFGHLALFTATQVLPYNLLPVYDDDKSCYRSELERRQKYIDQLEQKLGGDHDLIKLIKQCLHNSPKMRPTADDIIRDVEQLVVATHTCFVQ